MKNTAQSTTRNDRPSMEGIRRPMAMNQSSQSAQKKPRFPKPTLWAIAAAALLLAAVVTFLVMAHQGEGVKKDRYQAVFLEDGKVFFGHLTDVHGDYIVLEDAFYTQQQQSATANDENAVEALGQVNLVKVGEEVYGPEDSMTIRADQVLFWQNLTADNQIVKAIEAQNK